MQQSCSVQMSGRQRAKDEGLPVQNKVDRLKRCGLHPVLQGKRRQDQRRVAGPRVTARNKQTSRTEVAQRCDTIPAWLFQTFQSSSFFYSLFSSSSVGKKYQTFVKVLFFFFATVFSLYKSRECKILQDSFAGWYIPVPHAFPADNLRSRGGIHQRVCDLGVVTPLCSRLLSFCSHPILLRRQVPNAIQMPKLLPNLGEIICM